MLASEALRQSAYYDERHGGPYDRGSADAYYGRDYNPHYFVGDTYKTPRIEQGQMTTAELMAYTVGYANNKM